MIYDLALVEQSQGGGSGLASLDGQLLRCNRHTDDPGARAGEVGTTVDRSPYCIRIRTFPRPLNETQPGITDAQALVGFQDF